MLFPHFQGASRARLDRIYLPVSFLHSVNNYIVKPVYFSDHCLVTVTIGKSKRRKAGFNWSLWKLNGKLLEDKKFDDTIKNLLSEIDLTNNSFEKWQRIKEQIRILAIETSRTRVSESSSVT